MLNSNDVGSLTGMDESQTCPELLFKSSVCVVFAKYIEYELLRFKSLCSHSTSLHIVYF